MNALLPKNESTADRVVRVIGGLALIAAFFLVEGPWHWVGLLGFVFLATGLIGSCPIYTVLGLATNKGDDAAKPA